MNSLLSIKLFFFVFVVVIVVVIVAFIHLAYLRTWVTEMMDQQTVLIPTYVRVFKLLTVTARRD